MLCQTCQAPINSSDQFCTSCGTRFGHSASAPRATLPAPANVSWVDQKYGLPPLSLADDEAVVKDYTTCELDRPLGWLHSRLIVTNKRLIHQSRAKNSLNQSISSREVSIAQITGLSMSTHKGLTAVAAGMLISLAFPFFLLAVMVHDIADSLQVGGIFWFTCLLAASAFVILLTVKSRELECSLRAHSLESGYAPLDLVGSNSTDTLARFGSGLAAPVTNTLKWLGVVHASSSETSLDAVKLDAMYREVGAYIMDCQGRQRTITIPEDIARKEQNPGG